MCVIVQGLLCVCVCVIVQGLLCVCVCVFVQGLECVWSLQVFVCMYFCASVFVCFAGLCWYVLLCNFGSTCYCARVSEFICVVCVCVLYCRCMCMCVIVQALVYVFVSLCRCVCVY